MPEPLTLAAIFAYPYLIKFVEREALSAASDQLKNRSKPLANYAPVKKAIDKTLDEFPGLRKHDLRFVMEMWCNSGKFANIYESHQRDPQSVKDELILVGFNDIAVGYNASGEVAKQAQPVLMAFLQALHFSLLKTPNEGLAYHDALEAQRFEKLEAGSQSTINIQAATIARQSETIERLTLQIPAANTTPSSSDEKWTNDVERALKWSHSSDVKEINAAQLIVADIRKDPEFEQLSTELRSRLATILVVCADQLGQAQEAQAEAEVALKLNPENIACISNAAGIALINGDNQRAAELAQRALGKEPNHISAALVLLQAWQDSGELKRVEDFLRDNPWFLDSSLGLSTLAHFKSLAGFHEESIELSERALEIDGQNVQAWEEIFDSLFWPMREKMREVWEWDYSPEAKTKFERAAEAVSQAIAILEQGANTIKLHQALNNRAAVRSALGKTQDALDDCDRVLNGKPTPSVRDSIKLNKALTLMHAGRVVETIPLLESLEEEQQKKDSVFVLANAYQQAGQMEKAQRVCEEIWNPQECSAEQMAIASMLLSAYRQQEDDKGAQSVLQRAQKGCPDNPDIEVLIAQDKFDCGDIEGALTLLKKIAEDYQRQNKQPTRERILSSMGGLYYRSHRLTEAAQVWSEVEWLRLPSVYRSAYMDSLSHAKRYKEALEVARLIQQERGFDSRAAQTEAAISAYLEDWATAHKLWEDLSDREPNNPSHPINRASAALNADDKTTALRALKSVSYESIKNDAVLLRRVSEMQAQLEIKDAIRFAFRARQIDFGNPDSHNNYVQVFLKSTNDHSADENGHGSKTRAADVLGLNGPDWGKVPCAIRLMPVDSSDEKDRLDYTILAEEPFDLIHRIYPATDPFARQLLALKSKQQKIELPALPGQSAREYVVAELLHPFVHAFQESIAHSFEWFGHAGGLWSIDVAEGFDQFWAFMDDFGKGFIETMKIYEEWNFPLCVVSKVQSRSIFELWFFVSQRSQWGIHAERGSTEFFEKAVEKVSDSLNGAADKKPTLVLESTALLALVQLGVADAATPHFRFVIAESMHRKLKREAGETQMPHIAEGAFERLLSFVQDHVEVLPVKSLIDFPVENIERWRKVFGKEEVDALLLAREQNALFYSDDTLLREVGKSLFETEGVNTQNLVTSLNRREEIPQEKHYEILQEMALHNYRNLLLTSHFYQWLLKQHDNLPVKSVCAAFRYLEAPLCSAEAAIIATARLISKSCLSSAGLTIEMLNLCVVTLVTGRSIGPTLRALQLALCQPHFGLLDDEKSLRAILREIENWRDKLLN